MKKIIILILSILTLSCFLKANQKGQEEFTSLEEIASEFLLKTIPLTQDFQEFYLAYLKQKESFNAALERHCHVPLDCSPKNFREASTSCLLLLEEFASLPAITEDSIELYTNKIATAIKHSFPEEWKTLEEKNNLISLLFNHVLSSFVLKKIEALPVPSCSDTAQN